MSLMAITHFVPQFSFSLALVEGRAFQGHEDLAVPSRLCELDWVNVSAWRSEQSQREPSGCSSYCKDPWVDKLSHLLSGWKLLS